MDVNCWWLSESDSHIVDPAGAHAKAAIMSTPVFHGRAKQAYLCSPWPPLELQALGQSYDVQ